MQDTAFDRLRFLLQVQKRILPGLARHTPLAVLAPMANHRNTCLAIHQLPRLSQCASRLLPDPISTCSGPTSILTPLPVLRGCRSMGDGSHHGRALHPQASVPWSQVLRGTGRRSTPMRSPVQHSACNTPALILSSALGSPLHCTVYYCAVLCCIVELTPWLMALGVSLVYHAVRWTRS